MNIGDCEYLYAKNKRREEIKKKKERNRRDSMLIKELKELEQQKASPDLRLAIFKKIPDKYKTTICLGCGKRYADSNCGCPAGSGKQLKDDDEIKMLMRR